MVAEPILLDAERRARPPVVERLGMGYRWEIPDHKATLHVDYLRSRGGEIYGEFEARVDGKYIHGHAQHSLTSTNSRRDLAMALSTRTRGGIPWDQYLAQFCAAVIKAEREGDPLVMVGNGPIKRRTYLLDELVMEGKTNLLFGPGGGGKGYLAVRVCVSVATGYGLGRLTAKKATPIYFDWEDDADTMNERIQRVALGMNIEAPSIAYKRMKGIAADHVNEMARAIANAKATFAVLDSVSAASGQPGRGETWDSVAHRLFDAVEMIPSGVPGVPMTWLMVGHVTGDSATKPDDIAGKMFGSIQFMNRARNAWELRSTQVEGSSSVIGSLYNSKWNHTGRRPAIGMTVVFDGEAVTFDLGENHAKADATLADKLAHHFASNGPASVRALSLALRGKEGSIRTTLNAQRGTRFRQDEHGFWNVIGDTSEPEPEEEGGPIPW